jgi:hypothetical protein
LTESQWAVIRATLPTGANEAWFRSELERIAGDRNFSGPNRE